MHGFLARMFVNGDAFNVTPDVVCLQDRVVNAYLIGKHNAGDRQWVLVDAGLPGAAGSIRHAAERFGKNSRPAAIILTHGHFDHVGAVVELAKRWDAPVFAHALEMPYLRGKLNYAPPDPGVDSGLITRLSFLFPRGPIDLGQRVRALPSNGSLPGLPGWRWIHTPGHSFGHISLWHPANRLLIAGDAFVTTRQESLLSALTQKPKVHRPPAYFTVDWNEAGASVAKLAALRPDIVATGHGLPMSGATMKSQLRQLAEHFDEMAVPARGRYVQEAAVP